MKKTILLFRNGKGSEARVLVCVCVVGSGGQVGRQKEEAMAGGRGWGALRLSLFASASVHRLICAQVYWILHSLIQAA